MTKVKLPPEFCSNNEIPVERATIKRERMIEVLEEAIEADRQTIKVDKAGYTSGTVSDGGFDPRNANDRQATGTLTRQQIIDRFDFLEGIVGEHNFRRIYETAIEIAAVSDRQARGEPVGYIMDGHLEMLKRGQYANIAPTTQGGDVAVYLSPQPQQQAGEPVAYRWKKPIVNDKGTTVGYTDWVYGEEKKFFSWWIHESLYTAPQIPEGYQLVPIEPTEEMVNAAINDGVSVDGRPVWKHDVAFQARWRYQQMLKAYRRK